ncbi:GNAT family N-acetyltransferase [Vibrio sp. SCSIO 43140]|uniref:GNAT family N-acetyltransferase n=1 Tax=Vibrio sp. SCSIO 43140 TaxID=2819100 RepID=UPI002075247B|nr:GNAT family N-acetyltransferase [Vibrio sp. SCSIO 43140]USD61801.1 GNAT family N-acetyltransferase [Vibrio sp. SCSIO 43140]
MSSSMFDVREVKQTELPLDILLIADPEEAAINAYRERCIGFAVYMQGALVGALLVEVDAKQRSAELFNIAIYDEFQGKGFGGVLLSETLALLSQKGIDSVELGTGTFGYQLSFYQKHGFRVDSVVKNFFLDNYDEPIFEHGIQHKDMLRLIWRSNDQ